MAYHAPFDGFLKVLALDLGEGGEKVKLYLQRREEFEEARRRYLSAQEAYDEISKDVADHLLKVYEGIHRVEHHTEGEAWHR